ncbi:hypothetical protein DFR70_11492 [Nocardia tenerifensis]|uniref:Uncharacterized protein n=1 Tax=Nocardia tenerifensis TaxID=228006 RepID=A0A318K5P5_9NOCA|nr:hypothetical protein DFR70_11492 [Nocardia tenerifensis]
MVSKSPIQANDDAAHRLSTGKPVFDPRRHSADGHLLAGS